MSRHIFAPLLCLVACTPVTGTPPEPERELVVEARANLNRNVDLLFVVDDSPGMAEHQATLARSIPTFISTLATYPFGLPDIHIGVVTTDMGTKASSQASASGVVGGIGMGGCAHTGKDGKLLLAEATGVTGTFLSDIKLADGSRQTNFGSADLETKLAEMIRVGQGGCAFEQPLHSMRRALGNNPSNAGFLRDDALLAVVFVTDEDDCSAHDTALFADPTADNPLASFRCTRFGVTCDIGGQTPDEMNLVGTKSECAASVTPSQLDAVEPFRDFLVELKGDPSKVVVSGIIAAPSAVVVENVPPAPDLAPQPALAPTCSRAVGNQTLVGTPGVRLQTFFDLFPDRSSTGSICDNNFSTALDGTAALIARASGSQCLSKLLLDVDPDVAGLQVDCVVEDVLGTSVTPLPECGLDAIPTCWKLVRDQDACATGPDQLRLDVVRTSTPPDLVTHARCRVR